ncbi:MAG: hypothetical protein WCP69_11780 [Bacteroidota bacterium]
MYKLKPTQLLINIGTTFLFLLFFGAISAQTLKPLSADVDKTVSEIKDIYKNVIKENKEKAEKISKAFELYWISASINAAEKENFINMANLMIGKKMKAFPHLESFINAYMAFTETNPDENNIMKWSKGLVYMMDKSSSKFPNFLDDYTDFFRTNNIFNANQVQWYVTSDKFKIDFDTIPKIIFEKGNLIGRVRSDSIVLQNTIVTYYPTLGIAQTKGGRVTWERADFDPQKVYAEIPKSTIVLRKPNLEADSVLYTNTDFFSKPLKGRFIDKATLGANEDKATYPRFKSYDKRIVLNNYFENVDFEGGVEMRGARFLGSGDENTDVLLVFKRKGKRFMAIGSQEMVLKKGLIVSNMARAMIFIDNDTISHPAINFRYDDKKKEVILIRMNEGLSRGPFFNTYHKLDMYFEALYWKTDEAYFDFKMLPGPGVETSALFESEDYFDDTKLNEIKGFHEVNPLYKINKFFKDRTSQKAPLQELVNYLGYAPEDVKSFVIQLAILGFLEYDLDKEIVKVKSRLRTFIQAESHKRDYDIIRFASKVKVKENARLSLLNFDLQIHGVNAVTLSDSQIVNIYPKDGEITLKKNRDFEFSGKVEAGLFDFNAKKCEFNYEKFNLDMTVIDSVTFFVEDKKGAQNREGDFPLIKVRSVIEDIKGVIEIDQPNNKSGTISMPRYPIFTSTTPGYVYYNKPFIHNGIYKKEKFYFRVNPFVIEKLDDFATDSIEFNGYLVSADIFEDIVKPLKVRPDYSLGFIHQTPDKGMLAYGGKGIFLNKLDLSNQGLHGYGTINYITSTGTTNECLFFPDSSNASLDTYIVREQEAGTQYPAATGTNVYMHWEPYNNKMQVFSKDTPLNIFKDSKLIGNIEITPNGALACGKISIDKAELTSDKFELKHHEILSDTTSFNLKAYDFDEFSLRASNYKGHVDFSKRSGNFISNGINAIVDFPVNQYKTSCSEFDWMMDKDEISFVYADPYKETDINKTPSRDLLNMVSEGNYLTSTHPAQDSLSFSTTKAVYDLKNYIINAEGVRFIRVADAAIIPYGGTVKIYKKAEIETLNNSRVLANVTSKYHEFYDATTIIGAKNWYKSKGSYNYIDENNNSQKVIFDTIYVDKKATTFADGKILKESSFTLSPDFGFIGDVKLTAENEFLNFSGGVSLVQGCDTIQRTPLRFKADINPKEILIPANENSKDINNKKIANAIVATPEGRMYSAFATSKEQINDPEVVSAYGFLTFSKELDSYLITSAEKIADSTLPGNIIMLNKKTCIASGLGQIKLGAKLGAIDMFTFGRIQSFMMLDSTTIDLAATINFLFSEDLLKIFSDYIEGSSNFEGIDVVDNDRYHEAIVQILGNKDAEKAIYELKKELRFKKVPSKLMNTFLISDMKLKWNSEQKSFISYGDIGIALLGKNQVNKYVPGIIQIKKNRSRDDLYMYFKIDETEFFFQFKSNTMSIYSTDNDFMKKMTAMKSDERRSKSDKGKPSFDYRPGAKTILKKFKQTMGIAEEEKEE